MPHFSHRVDYYREEKRIRDSHRLLMVLEAAGVLGQLFIAAFVNGDDTYYVFLMFVFTYQLKFDIRFDHH